MPGYGCELEGGSAVLKRKLIIYPNCSKGGVCSVIRARARCEPDVHYDLIFFHDRGGKYAYDDIENISFRIVRKDRIKGYISYLTKSFEYEEVSVLSDPDAANLCSENENLIVVYEFHSSDMSVVQGELRKLCVDRLAKIYAPSEQMVSLIKEMVPPRIKLRTEVRPNQIDKSLFNSLSHLSYFERSKFDVDGSGIPLLWVGRFDGGKGYPYFLRALSMLPEEYYAIIVVSLESNISRVDKFYSECYAMGVQNRIRLLLDLPQSEMANIYRAVGLNGGALVSTSLMESFGYAVLEALESNVRVVAFDLPVWDNFKSYDNFHRVDSGDVQGVVKKIVNMP